MPIHHEVGTPTVLRLDLGRSVLVRLRSQAVCSSDATSSVSGAQQALLQQKIAISMARQQLNATATVGQGLVNMLQSVADSASKAPGKGENFSATA